MLKFEISSAVRLMIASQQISQSPFAAWVMVFFKSAARQSIDGGVMLPPAEEVDEYARFLSDAVRQHLDNEWIPQKCHKDIGEEVANLYHAAVKRVSGLFRRCFPGYL